ncbi:hypothetical protein FQN60_000025, partial [Etheostoma spectabile]
MKRRTAASTNKPDNFFFKNTHTLSTWRLKAWWQIVSFKAREGEEERRSWKWREMFRFFSHQSVCDLASHR